METFNKETLNIIKRLQMARLSLMKKQPFYAVLLLHMNFGLDVNDDTAYTDGNTIYFAPGFINALSDGELEFVLMHEVLHVALNHCGRKPDEYDLDAWNRACDIVVNSNICYSFDNDPSVITLQEFGESMHKAPNGKDGYLFSAEELYGVLQAHPVKKSNRKVVGQSASGRCDGGFDSHSHWGNNKKNTGLGDSSENKEMLSNEMQQVWLQRMMEATQLAQHFSNNNSSKSCGKIPLCADRILKELLSPQTDWRTVLDNFIQEEITDYSFNPPDRRFQDSSFILPDFNETEDSVKDVLFMIDTSASMSDQMITQAYSEIKGALAQFNGHLSGWLGFFDAAVVEPKEFSDENEFEIIKPKGGGGTNFKCIFDFVQQHLNIGLNPSSIIILTDGYAPFPNESDAMGIPVLWIINNEKVTPPWGKVARIKIDK